MKSNNRRPSGNIMMRLAAVLFCLVMFSTYLMGGLFARYTAKAGGNDNARVAKFDVVGTGGGLVEIRQAQQSNGNYLFTITNRSEVDVSYDVDVVFSEDVSAWLALKMDAKAPSAVTVDEENQQTTYRFENAGTLNTTDYKEHTAEFTVTNWNNGITRTMEHQEGTPEGTGTKELTFTVYVHAVQID